MRRASSTAAEFCMPLETCDLAAGSRSRLLAEHHALGVPLVLVAGVVGERRAQRHDVVGEDARLGVADDRGDGLRLAGDLGLPPERLQLPADLPGQVAEARQVGLHRVELAKGLLLAAAVLEDPRGLLDETAPVLGRGLQHRVEPALTRR